MRPQLLISGSREIVNALQPDWWAHAPTRGFTALAESQLPRMRQSKFAAATRASCTGDEPARPSSLSLYKQGKRMRELFR